MLNRLSHRGCTDSIFLSHKGCTDFIFLSRRGCTDSIFLRITLVVAMEHDGGQWKLQLEAGPKGT